MTMVDHSLPWSTMVLMTSTMVLMTMVNHGFPCSNMVLMTMANHGKPWSTIKNRQLKHGCPWLTMVFHGCMTMNYHGSPWYSMVVHGHVAIIFERSISPSKDPLPSIPNSSPSWCICTNCREMLQEDEWVCCGKKSLAHWKSHYYYQQLWARLSTFTLKIAFLQVTSTHFTNIIRDLYSVIIHLFGMVTAKHMRVLWTPFSK